MVKKQFLKFIVIGVFSTFVNYSVFYVLYNFLFFHYLFSSGVGFLAGVFAGYNLNKTWSFGIKEKSFEYVFKYYIVYTISLFLGLGSLYVLVNNLGILPEIANVITIGLTTCTNFIGIKIWVFKK